MLPPEDLQWVKRQPALIGLAMALDPCAIRTVLAKRLHLPEETLQLSKNYVRLKPGMSCLVHYYLIFQGQQWSFYVTAQTQHNAAKLGKSRQRNTASTLFKCSRFVLAEQKVEVVFFPNDNKINKLRKIVAADVLPHLNLIEAPGACLAYKPERRFVGRVGTHAPFSVIRVYPLQDFARIAKRLRFAADYPHFPDLLHKNSKRGYVLMQWQPGEALNVYLQQHPEQTLDLLQQVGQTLLSFHQHRATRKLRVEPKQQHAQILSIQQELVFLLPDMAADVQCLTDYVLRTLPETASAKTVIHGDFYADQVLYHEHTLSFIDADDIRWGHPLEDIGLFLAHLLFAQNQQAQPLEAVRAGIAAFLSGYYNTALDPSHESDLRPYLVSGMLQIASRPFRQAKTGWASDIQRWLRLCRDVMVEDHRLPFLAATLDVNTMQAYFQPDWQLMGTQLMRHKKNKRALVAYQLVHRQTQAKQTLIGKTRAKGLDKRGFQVSQQLYQQNIQMDSPYRLCFAAPFGCIPEYHMWIQHQVPGQTAWQALSQTDDPNAAAAGIADALYALHTHPVATQKQHSIADELAILNSGLAELAQRHPHRAPALSTLMQEAARVAQLLGSRPRTGIHRDFYPDQVLLAQQDIYVLDLDLYCLGDAAVDVGNFIAHLQEHDLRCHANPMHSQAVQQAFLSRYVELSGDADCRFASQIYRVLTLARHVYLSLRFAQRAPFSPHILDFCLQQMNLIEGVT